MIALMLTVCVNAYEDQVGPALSLSDSFPLIARVLVKNFWVFSELLGVRWLNVYISSCSEEMARFSKQVSIFFSFGFLALDLFNDGGIRWFRNY
jgi:hypothetical protein